MARKKPTKITGFNDIDVQFLGSREEPAEERTVESRKKLRDNLNSQVDAFLKNGGQIEAIPPHTTSNANREESTPYGNQPL